MIYKCIDILAVVQNPSQMSKNLNALIFIAFVIIVILVAITLFSKK